MQQTTWVVDEFDEYERRWRDALAQLGRAPHSFAEDQAHGGGKAT